ncbi:LOG family [Sesbania bispinosa]|nr:LOG family [Sesbania bispinosa]
MEIQQQPTKSRFRRICVYCGSSPGKSPSYQLAAIQLGEQLVDMVPWKKLLEIITWAQLGIHDKPVGLLNVDGYYNSLLAFMDKAVDEGFVTPAARHIIVSAHTAQDLMCKLEEYVPKHCGVAPKLSWEMEQQLVNTAKSDISR